MGTRIAGGAGYSNVDCDRTLQEVVFEGEACGCRPGGHAELLVDGTPVGVYGATADEELLGHLLIVGPPATSLSTSTSRSVSPHISRISCGAEVCRACYFSPRLEEESGPRESL
jgi:hypothetical protein